MNCSENARADAFLYANDYTTVISSLLASSGKVVGYLWISGKCLTLITLSAYLSILGGEELTPSCPIVDQTKLVVNTSKFGGERDTVSVAFSWTPLKHINHKADGKMEILSRRYTA